MKYLFALMIPVLGIAQVAAEANKGYKDAQGRAGVASTLVSEGRDARQKPKELIAAMGLKPGMTVADIGTGAGYMLPFLSSAVGSGGKVLAEDIFPDFLEAAKKRGARLPNVEYFLGDTRSVRLPRNSADMALVLDAYHHFDYPKEMIASIREALKPGGRMVIVEYHKNDKSMPNGRALQHIRATREEFVKEIESFGLRAVEVKDFIPDVQWMAIFEER